MKWTPGVARWDQARDIIDVDADTVAVDVRWGRWPKCMDDQHDQHDREVRHREDEEQKRAPARPSFV
jgi:hypothetical protein